MNVLFFLPATRVTFLIDVAGATRNQLGLALVSHRFPSTNNSVTIIHNI